MSERRVMKTGKDEDGDITKLCHSGEYWSPRSKRDAIADIERGTHKYYVRSDSGTAYIRVVNGPKGKYLRTDADATSSNNLTNLPDC